MLRLGLRLGAYISLFAHTKSDLPFISRNFVYRSSLARAQGFVDNRSRNQSIANPVNRINKSNLYTGNAIDRINKTSVNEINETSINEINKTSINGINRDILNKNRNLNFHTYSEINESNANNENLSLSSTGDLYPMNTVLNNEKNMENISTINSEKNIENIHTINSEKNIEKNPKSSKNSQKTEPPKSFKMIDPRYTTIKEENVEEYNIKSYEFLHTKTNGKVVIMQLQGDSIPTDEEQVFMACMNTPNNDSTGIAHVLEHSVLCGSDKYPVKEPFLELLKGSMYSFLNAFTYPDRTCYPVASINQKDFFNLAHVYMDALTTPRVLKDPNVLAQEGWRYTTDSTTTDDFEQLKLKYTGVVYNEMKGVYSSPESMMGRYTIQSLFPGSAYSKDSGGTPEIIPQLKFEDVRDFFMNHYHPSNAVYYFWGYGDIKEKLDFLDPYLSSWTNTVDTDLTKVTQSQLHEPFRKYFEYALSKSETQSKDLVTLNWVTDAEGRSMEIPTQYKSFEDQLSKMSVPCERIAISVLQRLLLETPVSTLYKELNDSKMGERIIGGGYDDDLAHTIFSVGLNGFNATEEEIKKFEKLVLDCLKKKIEEKFSRDEIEAAINTKEFTLRENNTGTFPKGLALALSHYSELNAKRDPLSTLKFEKPLNELKKLIENGVPVLEYIVDRDLLLNQHRCLVVLKGNKGLGDLQNEKEEETMKEIKLKLGKEGVLKVIENEKLLKDAQSAEDTPENLAKLPSLTRSDIPREAKEPQTSIEHYPEKDVVVLKHNLLSTGILYVDLAFNMDFLNKTDLLYLPLFTRLITETSTENKTLSELTHYIGTHTGGISAKTEFNSLSKAWNVIATPDDATGYFILHGKTLKDKNNILFSIFEEIALYSNLDDKNKAFEIVKNQISASEGSVVSSGDAYARIRLSSSTSVSSLARESTSGLSSIYAKRGILEQIEKDWDEVLSRLTSIREKLFKKNNLKIYNLSGDKVCLDSVDPDVYNVFRGENMVENNENKSENDEKKSENNEKKSENNEKKSENNKKKSENNEKKSENDEKKLTNKHIPPPVIYTKIENNNITRVHGEWNKELSITLNSISSSKENEFFSIQGMINYVAMKGQILKPNEVYVPGFMTVLSTVISRGVLWDEVRVKGGAYGAGFNIDDRGYIYFSSYRDPEISKTLSSYKDIKSLLENHFQTLTSRDLDRYVIGAIRASDQPKPANQKGYEYLWDYIGGVSYENKNQYRKQILEMTKKNMEDTIHTICKPMETATDLHVVVVGDDTLYKRQQNLEEYSFNVRDALNGKDISILPVPGA